jgi:hypothetical protein
MIEEIDDDDDMEEKIKEREKKKKHCMHHHRSLALSPGDVRRLKMMTTTHTHTHTQMIDEIRLLIKNNRQQVAARREQPKKGK